MDILLRFFLLKIESQRNVPPPRCVSWCLPSSWDPSWLGGLSVRSRSRREVFPSPFGIRRRGASRRLVFLLPRSGSFRRGAVAIAAPVAPPGPLEVPETLLAVPAFSLPHLLVVERDGLLPGPVDAAEPQLARLFAAAEATTWRIRNDGYP